MNTETDETHQRYFSRSLAKIGREFSEEMPLVCERFRLIYKSVTVQLKKTENIGMEG